MNYFLFIICKTLSAKLGGKYVMPLRNLIWAFSFKQLHSVLFSNFLITQQSLSQILGLIANRHTAFSYLLNGGNQV